ncbi:Stf0 family sulfotransferase [Acidocella sp.]|uniref:Stf0 family sulfotransferase n=1 Tax=Acidocella sp. TaxID=50710 RepID=UPI0026037334|nr:Stf0 family sulfotransferase [Acidocella sp.]
MKDNEELRFETLVAGLEVEGEAYRQNIWGTKLPVRDYVIFFSARSGSTWLTSMLSATRRLGFPEEYLNPAFIRDVAQFLNAAEPVRFLNALRRRRQTQNGLFGLETRAVDVRLFGEAAFFEAFGPETVFFNLWRENIAAQAVSLYRAVTTGRYHSTDPDSATPPRYDTEAILEWLAHLVEQENDNLRMLKRHGRGFEMLRYESMVRDREATLDKISQAVGVTAEYGAQAGTGETRKIGDEWNREAERRLRAERGGELARIEAERLVRLVGP